MKKILFLLFIFINFHTASIADMKEGMDAYSEGNYELAIVELTPYANQGVVDAQVNLSLIYASGKGIPKDAVQALFWARKAADQGSPDAQFMLSIFYSKGLGTPKDTTTGTFWCLKAAENGYGIAQTRLGYMYMEGEDVPQNDDKALYWSRKAAAQVIHPESALVNLAVFYIGPGKRRDLAYAYFLFNAAIANGAKYEKSRDTLKTKLTQKEVKKAESLIAGWKSGTPLPLP